MKTTRILASLLVTAACALCTRDAAAQVISLPNIVLLEQTVAFKLTFTTQGLPAFGSTSVSLKSTVVRVTTKDILSLVGASPSARLVVRTQLEGVSVYFNIFTLEYTFNEGYLVNRFYVVQNNVPDFEVTQYLNQILDMTGLDKFRSALSEVLHPNLTDQGLGMDFSNVGVTTGKVSDPTGPNASVSVSFLDYLSDQGSSFLQPIGFGFEGALGFDLRISGLVKTTITGSLKSTSVAVSTKSVATVTGGGRLTGSAYVGRQIDVSLPIVVQGTVSVSGRRTVALGTGVLAVLKGIINF
jgi:hypothetical protein